jgi:hypothetical protein
VMGGSTNTRSCLIKESGNLHDCDRNSLMLMRGERG